MCVFVSASGMAFKLVFDFNTFGSVVCPPKKKVKKVKLQDEFIRISGESVSNYTIIRWSSIPPTQSARLEMKKLLLRLFAVLPVWFYIWSLECVDSLLRRY